MASNGEDCLIGRDGDGPCQINVRLWLLSVRNALGMTIVIDATKSPRCFAGTYPILDSLALLKHSSPRPSPMLQKDLAITAHAQRITPKHVDNSFTFASSCHCINPLTKTDYIDNIVRHFAIFNNRL
jgi:hypothetical protein